VIYHSADDIGQGCNTIAAQIAAEEFGVSMDRVKVIFADTFVTPFFNAGSTSSRVTYHLGNAVKAACRNVKKKLFEAASEKLRVGPDQLETRGGEVYVRGMPEKKIRITELFLGYKGEFPGGYGAYAKGGEIVGDAVSIQEYAPEDPETGQIDAGAAEKGLRLVSFWTYTAKAVEVAVNVETGQVRVLRAGSAVDMGRPINPKMCEQQMEGGMGMAIGDSLFEEMQMHNGVVANPNFTDYRIPSIIQMPLMENVKSVCAPVLHKDGPYGAKGLGEVAFVGFQPAIANAIYNAVGVRMKGLPITAEKLLRALRNKDKQEK
jgi:CO/xanthine dehydrogenase Mo-binding subunit